MEEIDLPNSKRMIMLGEKETNKYLGILEAEKHVEMKKRKNTSRSQENYSKQNYTAKISSKGQTPGLSSVSDTRDYS